MEVLPKPIPLAMVLQAVAAGEKGGKFPLLSTA